MEKCGGGTTGVTSQFQPL